MIIGRNFTEKLYSISGYYEDEKLYSTGNEDLDNLLERAFCEGYEYAQKEFGKTGLTAEQAKQFFTKTGNRELRRAGEFGLKKPSQAIKNFRQYAKGNPEKVAERIRANREKRTGSNIYAGVKGGLGFNSIANPKADAPIAPLKDNFKMFKGNINRLVNANGVAASNSKLYTPTSGELNVSSGSANKKPGGVLSSFKSFFKSK